MGTYFSPKPPIFNTMKTELQVSAIKEGTVIDHIPAKYVFNVIQILKLDEVESSITIGNNLFSKKLGKKAILKIADKFFQDTEIDKIALIAPNAKLNTIKDYKVVEKRIVETPKQVVGFVQCMNPKCITNHERVTTKFQVIDTNPIDLKCTYCEKITDYHNIVIKDE